MKKLITILCVIPLLVYGGNGELKRALEYFNAGHYDKALAIYSNESNLKETNLIRYAICLQETGHLDESENLYSAIYRDYSDVDSVRLLYSEVLLKNNAPEKALEVLSGCKVKSEKYNELFSSCNFSIKNKTLFSRAEIVETDVNPKGPLFGLAAYRDGFLTSVVKDGQYTVGYVDYYANEVHTIEPLKIFSTADFDGAIYVGNPSISDNGTLYFSASGSKDLYYNKNKTEKKGFNNKGENRLKLFTGEYSSDKISGSKALPFCINEYNYVSPFIVGDKLYFASDMLGGFGGYDLYVVQKLEKGWSAPKNLGNAINTPGDEMFPYVDGDDFYFSSTGHQGYGGADIFYSNGESKPINLGFGVNSSKDDFSFIKSVKDGEFFFISNRSNSYGLDQVFHVKSLTLSNVQVVSCIDKISNEVITIESIKRIDDNGSSFVQMSDENALLGTTFDTPLSGDYQYEFNSIGYQLVTVEGDVFDKSYALDQLLFTPNFSGRLFNSITGEVMAGAKIVAYDKEGNVLKSTVSDINGDWYLAAPDEAGVIIVIENENFQSDTLIASEWVGKKGMNHIQPSAEKGTKIEIRNIYFEYGKALITPESYYILDNILNFLNSNPGVIIELSAHTDSRGSNNANLGLSQKRAQTAFDYLVARGIDKSRLVAKGYGETMPVNKCLDNVECNEEEHQLNRRVEMKVL